MNSKKRRMMVHALSLALAGAMLCLAPIQALAGNREETQKAEQTPVLAEGTAQEERVVNTNPISEDSAGKDSQVVDPQPTAEQSRIWTPGTITGADYPGGPYPIMPDTSVTQEGQQSAGVMAAAVQNGWSLEGGLWYYYKNGIRQTGWLQDGGAWYYLRPAMTTAWYSISGYWYFFDRSTGKMRTGWLQDGTSWYYLKSDGKMATSWLQIGLDWFFFKESSPQQGSMLTGWLQWQGSWFYLDPSSGKTTFGWRKIDGSWYYFAAAPSGRMQTGWQQVSGKWYYLGSNGKMWASAWYTRTNSEGLQEEFYLGSDGVMVTGWKELHRSQGWQWNYFPSSGILDSAYSLFSGLRFKSGVKTKKYYIDSSASAYTTAINRAVSSWNLTGLVSLSQGTSAASSMMRFYTDYSYADRLAINEWREVAYINGIPYENVVTEAHGRNYDFSNAYINRRTCAGRTLNENQTTVAHEMGHGFGLKHVVAQKCVMEITNRIALRTPTYAEKYAIDYLY